MWTHGLPGILEENVLRRLAEKIVDRQLAHSREKRVGKQLAQNPRRLVNRRVCTCVAEVVNSVWTHGLSATVKRASRPATVTFFFETAVVTYVWGTAETGFGYC